MRRAQIGVEVLNRKIQNAQQRAVERKNQVWIARYAAQSLLGVEEESLNLKQRGQLAVRAIEDWKHARRIESATALEGSDGRQRRCPPPVRDDTKAEPCLGNERGLLQNRNESFNRVQWLLDQAGCRKFIASTNNSNGARSPFWMNSIGAWFSRCRLGALRKMRALPLSPA